MFVFGIHKKAISKKSRRNCEWGAGSSLEEGEIVRQSEVGDIDNVAQRLK